MEDEIPARRVGEARADFTVILSQVGILALRRSTTRGTPDPAQTRLSGSSFQTENLVHAILAMGVLLASVSPALLSH